ncbi:MAG: metallophosphoesterase [Myxococcales bacterium]|nr:metallophosphoesterase [Myxococcales bacterium]
MEPLLPDLILAALIGAGIPLYAGSVRGRRYASFALVVLLFSLPAALVLHARLLDTVSEAFRPALVWGFRWMLIAAGLHLAFLVRPRLRRRAFRYGVSVPGMAFLAMGAVAGPWLLALLPLRVLLDVLGAEGLLGALRWLDLAPLAVVVAGVATSVQLREEIVRVPLAPVDAARPAELTRLPVSRHRRSVPPPLDRRPLRLVQISDPHLGPFQPIHRLQRRLERVLQHDPDLVLLTGDFLTMEGSGSPGALAEALAPLRALPGRCYAIFGNHDHEAPEEVRGALESAGARLLLDEEALVDTPFGAVQLVGADHHFKEAKDRLHELVEKYPRRDDHLRLVLVHDPLRFGWLPEGDADLALSGHTHGGQVGLVSFGLDWTVLSRSRWPDHGLFGRGQDRLYVHRGTGFYGFPLRLGVPGELSLLEVMT